MNGYEARSSALSDNSSSKVRQPKGKHSRSGGVSPALQKSCAMKRCFNAKMICRVQDQSVHEYRSGVLSVNLKIQRRKEDEKIDRSCVCP